MLKRSKQSILILSGRYGEGHYQAALAIKKTILKIYPNYDVLIKDPQALTHPKIDHMSKQLFLFGVRRFPGIYHFLYQKTREANSMSQLFKGMSRLGLKSLAQWINTIKPEAIICTCPVSCGMAGLLKKYQLVDIPVMTVVTDYSVHNYWIHPQIDHYFVGSQEVKEGLLRYGIETHRISVTGVPVDPKFTQEFDKNKLMEKHGLRADIPTVLISGGGCGIIGNGSSIFEVLEKVPGQLQIICICGHNHSLYQALLKDKEVSKHFIIVKGYVNFIDELMAISDMMVTKAGGLTISEAIALKLPLLIYRSIGGQERDNTQYLLNNGAALVADNEQDLIKNINTLVYDLSLKMSLIKNMGKIQHKRAALIAVQTIFHMLSESYSHHG